MFMKKGSDRASSVSESHGRKAHLPANEGLAGTVEGGQAYK